MLKNIARGALHRINKLLSPIDSHLLMNGAPVAPPLFIVGAPRSGTTLTYQVITQQMRVSYFTAVMNYLYGAPNLITRVLKPFYHRPTPIFESTYGKIPSALSPAENANFWFQWFPEDGEQGHYVEPADLRLDFYSGLKDTVDSLSRITGRPMVFKNLYLSMVVGTLAQIFKDARFIFVSRDRFYTCQSLYQARFERSKSQHWWSVKIPQYRELQSMPLWYQVVDQVVCTESIVQEGLDKFAHDRYMKIRYEDLCARPHQIVKHFQDWLSPLGYEIYADIRVPQRFDVSMDKSLPADLIRKINGRLSGMK